MTGFFEYQRLLGKEFDRTKPIGKIFRCFAVFAINDQRTACVSLSLEK